MGKKIVSVEIVDAEKRRIPSKHYVYVIVVKWSDGSCFKIYRRYSRFFDLQTVLLDSFPIEGGSLDPSKRLIPFLPGKIFFGRSHIKDVAMKRLGEINVYCQSLVALPAKISQCDHVLEFFEVELDDLDPPVAEPNESKKGTSSKDKTVEKISKPKRLEAYLAVAEYQVQAPGELALQPGMRVEVLEKNDIGWWFVNSEDEQGWVPSTYLEPDEGTYMSQVPKALPGEEEMFVCIEDFEASSQDEVSLEKGVAVSVLQKNMDGWWLVRYQGREAFAPGTYLKKATNATRMSMMEKSRVSGVEIVSSLQDVSTLLNNDNKDKNKSEVSTPGKLDRRTVPSALIKTRSMERGGSLKPPPRQNSIKKMEAPILSPKSTIYVTIADFTDSVGDGVSFQEGQKVLVLEKTGTGWWLIRLGQEEGWVPASYLQSYTGKMDTSSVYELANSQSLIGGQENTYEGSDNSASDDNEWYTEPDEVEECSRITSPPFSQHHDSKRPLPEIPQESGDYEPVVEVKATRPLPPQPQPDSDCKPVSTLGTSDLASVLKAKFESRTAGTENVTSQPDGDRNVKPLKPVVPSLPTKPPAVSSLPTKPSSQSSAANKPSGVPLLPTKPSEMKKLQKATPSKTDQNIRPANPPPPPKPKSSDNPPLPSSAKGVFPKFPLKPVQSGDRDSGSKSDAKPETKDVKNMAAMLTKSLNPKPAVGESAPPVKVPIAPKPQVASKPKPSIPSKPSVAAKPKPTIQPKSGGVGVNSLANSLNNKLNLNNNNTKSNKDMDQKDDRSNTRKSKPQTFVALYDFVGEGEGEISFNEGDNVEIVETNGDWVFIQLWDEQGWAPAAYFQEI